MFHLTVGGTLPYGPQQRVELRSGGKLPELLNRVVSFVQSFFGFGSEPVSPSRIVVDQNGATKLIVLVHGIFGSGTGTWGSGDTYWPYLVESDPRFRGYDVYTVNYLSTKLRRSANIHEVARNELQRMKDTGLLKKYSEIHIIAHSMGGLVSKSMLTRLARDEDPNLLTRFHSVIFFIPDE